MVREDVVNFCRLYHSSKLKEYDIVYFLWSYCVHRGKDPELSKLFATTAVATMDLRGILDYALEWCEKEFSINKLYSAPDPNGNRSMIQIF